MSFVKLRGGNTTIRCSRCVDGLYEVDVDGVVLCERCLVQAIRATAPKRPDALTTREANHLEAEITRLTGHAVRNLKCLPIEVIEDLRRAIRNVEQEKSNIHSKLGRYGLPGI